MYMFSQNSFGLVNIPEIKRNLVVPFLSFIFVLFMNGISMHKGKYFGVFFL